MTGYQELKKYLDACGLALSDGTGDGGAMLTKRRGEAEEAESFQGEVHFVRIEFIAWRGEKNSESLQLLL